MSDLFFAPSKPAWIKRFRKPAVCNKNPRFLCLHFPVPFPRLKTPRLHIYSSQRCCRVFYTGSNSLICENAVPFMGGILHSGWIDMLQAGSSLWDWRIEARQAYGCLLLSGIVFLRAGGNMRQLVYAAVHPGFPKSQSCHISLLQENLFFYPK